MFPTAQELCVGIMAYGPMADRHVRALEVKLDAGVLAEIDEIMKGAAGQIEELANRHHEREVRSRPAAR